MWNNIKRLDDRAERVTKFVFEKADAVVESVLYRYPTYEERTVICFSTQSGCPVGCRFCGTGDYFVRNLTPEEIVFQVDYSLEQTCVNPNDIKNLQLMGMSMGEPLLALKSLIPALEILHSKYPNAKLLISTSGPDVDYEPFMQLAEKIPTIGLQFSVHESTDESREKLVPFKKKLSLLQMYWKGREFFQRTGRKPFFNYCAHEKNSSQEDAYVLWEIYDPNIFNATVSVICEREEGFSVSNEHQRSLAVDFSQKLVELGFDVRVFDPAGQDTVGGGCGQLRYVQDWFKNNPEHAKPSVGFGKEIVHAPQL